MADIFLPRMTRESRNSPAKEYFLDLSNHPFSAEEKAFVARELVNESILLPRYTISNNLTAADLSIRHNIPASTIRNWKSLYENPSKSIRSGGGRPRDIDEEGIQELKAQVIEARKVNAAMDEDIFNDLYSKHKSATLKRAYKTDITAEDLTKSDKTVKRFREDHQLSLRKAQDLTKARVAALKDIRVAYRQACCLMAFASELTAEYKWNADATTILVEEVGTGSYCVIVRDKDDHSPVTSSQRNNGLGILIKWMHLCNAAGEAGPLVCIISLDSLPANKFFVRKVKALSNCTSVGAYGWLYICNSKAGNDGLWKHWFINVVVQTLRLGAEAHNHLDCNGKPMRPFLNTDGEAIIMNQAFDDEVIKEFADAEIDYMKGAPSGTSQHQPADVSSNFRDVKTGMRTVIKEKVNTYNKTLHDNLQTYFREFGQEYPTITVSQSFKTKAIVGLEKLSYVLKGKYFTADKMIKGFLDCGQHVNTVLEDEPTVSYDTLSIR